MFSDTDSCIFLQTIFRDDDYAKSWHDDAVETTSVTVDLRDGHGWETSLNASPSTGVPSNGTIPTAYSPQYDDPALRLFKFILASVVTPSLCIFGLVGNILNIIVLSRRRMRVAMNGKYNWMIR